MNTNLSPRPRRARVGALPRTPWLASERGDVPGGVLITLMTAGLVVALWALAGPSLGQVFNQAVTRVVSF
jgi:hypothetical protein